jgi:hypothetical protein
LGGVGIAPQQRALDAQELNPNSIIFEAEYSIFYWALAILSLQKSG